MRPLPSPDPPVSGEGTEREQNRNGRGLEQKKMGHAEQTSNNDQLRGGSSVNLTAIVGTLRRKCLLFVMIATGLSTLLAPVPARAVDLGNGFSLSNVTYLDFTAASGDLLDTTSNKGISASQAKTNDGLANGFHFSRVYLTLMKQFDEKFTIRITTDQMTVRPDGKSEASPFGLSGFAGDNRGNLFIKYVYAQYKLSPEMMLRVGLNQTPWIDEAENRWTLRFLRPTYWDEQGAITSSDLGVSLLGNLFNKLVGYHIMFSNGEGYENNGIDGRGYAAQGRIDLFPLPGVTLSAFGLTETVHAGIPGWNEDREIFYAMYTHSLFRVAAEYMMADDNATGSVPLTIMTTPSSSSGSKGPATSTNTARFDQGKGYGVWAWTRIPEMEALRLFGRFYAVRPNTSTPAGKMTEVNGGIAYDVSQGITVALDDTYLIQKLLNTANGSIQNFRDNIFGVRALLTF
jgi:hypothetical protein